MNKNLFIQTDSLDAKAEYIFNICFDKFVDDLRYYLVKELNSGTQIETVKKLINLIEDIESENEARLKALEKQNNE